MFVENFQQIMFPFKIALNMRMQINFNWMLVKIEKKKIIIKTQKTFLPN